MNVSNDDLMKKVIYFNYNIDYFVNFIEKLFSCAISQTNYFSEICY